MITINYYSHILLQSKYAFILKIITIFLIYLTFNYNNISLCMTEGNDIPVTAEAKPTTRPKVELSNLEKLIHRNIDSYIGDKALIVSQQEEITRLAKEVEFHEELLKAMDTKGYLEPFVTEDDDTGYYVGEVLEKYNKSLDSYLSGFDPDSHLPDASINLESLK